MTKIHMKLATAFWCGLAAFSAGALEHGLMRIPDSLAPRREEIVNEVGYANAVSIQLPGGGSMMLQNEMGGGVMSSPIPVHAVEAVGGFLEKFQKNKSIAAEVSGTTWFACALEEADFAGQRCSFFEGPIVVKGYCFVLYLRTPADRGLDASVRAVLRQVTLLPPEDGNSEPTIPLVKMDLAKVPPVKDIPEWAEIAEAHKRTVETAAKAADQPQGGTSAPAAECARMRVPDSLKAILRPETGAIKLPVPGGGHVWVTNYNCGDGTDEYQDVPVPVRTAAARDAAIQSAPEDRLILAEISGTTLFAVQEDFDFDNEIDGEPVVAFGGVAIVKGYLFEMEISAPRNRGLDGTVRELLRQVTFLPPEDGNAEPPVPVLTNARAKAPPMKIEDMTGWRSKVKQFTRDPKARTDEIDDAVAMFTADDGLTAAEAGESTVGGAGNNSSAVAAGDQPTTAEFNDADAAPEVELPPVKISTPEEIEAGFAALPPLPAVRDLGEFKTVKPILPDDFLNSVSRKSVIANVREIMRELQGPLSDADTKRFDERWEAVIDYPSDEILEWLKKASPLLSELMMLKAAMSDNVMSYNEALAEANFARDYGDYESARAAVMQIGEVASTMKSIQARMDKIGASLDELGEMPDPAEQKKSDAVAHKAARKAVLGMFRDESEIDGEYALTGPYLYCEWDPGKEGKLAEKWSLEKGAVGGVISSVFGADKLFIRKVVEHDKTGVTGLYVYDYGKSGEQGTVLQAKHDGKGGYIVYSGMFGKFFKNPSGERVTLKMEFEDDNNGILVIRGHHVESGGKSSAWTMQMRTTGVSYTCMPGADTTEDSPEEVAAIFTEEKFGKVWGEMWDGAEKNYAEVYKKIKPPCDEIPFASTVRYVLRGMEPFDTNHPMPPEKRDILKAPKFYAELADSMVPKDPKKNEPRPQAQAAVLHVGGAGGFTFGKKTSCDIFFINPKNGRKVTMDTAESDVQARWGIPTPVFRAADGKCTIDVWTDIKRCEGSQHRGKYPLEDWLEFTLHAPNAAGGNLITKKCGDGSLKTSSTIVLLSPWTLPDRISLELRFLAFQGYAGKGVRFIYERAMMDEHDAELTARETMADFETAMKKELDADVFGKIFKAVKENSDKQLAGAEEALTADMTDEMANDPNRMKAEEIQQFQELAKAAEDEAVRLEKEIAAEKDPKRKETLNFLLVCKQSDRIEALARADAVATGEWHAPRTPFDDMCHVQMMESAMRELAESEELSHVRDGWARMMSHLSQADRDRAEMILENHIKDDRLNPKLWREVIYKLHDQDVNETMGRIHMLTDKELAAEDMIKRFEKAKFWCDLGMAAAGIGGASRVWAYAYSMGWGYIENGPKGIAKGAITTCSSMIDVIWSGYDGYKNGGAWGAIQAAGWSGFLNYGLPKVLEKVPWHADVTPRFGQKPTYKSADVVRMEIETRRATKDISDYTVKKNLINELEFKPETPGSTKMVLKRPNGKIVTDAELKVMRKAVVQAAAKINANPTAKAILKYSKGYKKIGADYDMELGRIHDAVKAQYYKSMEAKGFNPQQIESIRNASSKGTVGMDADWGLVEGKPITRYGRPCSKYEYMTEGQKSWNTDYKKTTGFSAEDSWENLTTSIHPEAYRNRAALSMSESGIKTRNLIRNMSPADAKQMMDVSRYKADSMMNSKRFPRLVRVREAARGAAKDMGGKMLPAIKSRIDSLKRLEGMAGKHGKALSKSRSHDLKRLEAAYDRYSRIHSKLDKIGKGELPPEDWDDTIKTATGGLTISEMLGELGDIFVSLSRK